MGEDSCFIVPGSPTVRRVRTRENRGAFLSTICEEKNKCDTLPIPPPHTDCNDWYPAATARSRGTGSKHELKVHYKRTFGPVQWQTQ